MDSENNLWHEQVVKNVIKTSFLVVPGGEAHHSNAFFCNESVVVPWIVLIPPFRGDIIHEAFFQKYLKLQCEIGLKF
jgi:hypothetical protein